MAGHGFAELTDDGLTSVLAAYQAAIEQGRRDYVKADGSPRKKVAGWIAAIAAERARRDELVAAEVTSWADDVSWTLVVTPSAEGEVLSWCRVPDPSSNEHSAPVTRVRRLRSLYFAEYAPGELIGTYLYQADAIRAAGVAARMTEAGS